VSRENDRTYREDCRPRRSADEHAASPVRGQHSTVQRISDKRSPGKPTTSGTRHEQTKAALKCYQCGEAKRSDSPGRRNPSERSRHPHSSNEKPSYAFRREAGKGNKNQGI
jgi:hypothetical protein